MVSGGKILLISDNESYAVYIKDQINGLGAYSVSVESSMPAAVAELKQSSYDLVFVRYGLLQAGAIGLLGELKKIDPDSVIIIFFEKEEELRAKELTDSGVYDLLSCPVDKEKLKPILEKGIKLHALLLAGRKYSQGLKENNQALERQNMLLAKRIEDATTNLTRLYEDLRSTYMRTIKVLAQAIEARDQYTHSHSENVARIAIAIANYMRLPAKDIEVLRQACELHDLGKIGIGDGILLKPSALTPDEWEQIRKHPAIGAQILEPLTFLSEVVDLIRQHHEHYDGTGYPDGRKGSDILLGARIIHIADAYEAMRSSRSYRKAPLAKEEAILEIKRNSGTQFDPKIVEVFLKVVDNL